MRHITHQSNDVYLILCRPAIVKLMKKHNLLSVKMHSIRITASITVLGLMACTTPAVKKQQVFDFTNIGRIELQITASDPAILPPGLIDEVSSNLAGWDYPVGAKNGEAFSHALKASVGEVTYGTTPTGFSFSSGNSDPRALDFQKTYVLPISCKLTALAQPGQVSELNLGFATNLAGKDFLARDKLADHIGTACFNLLTEVKWPLQAQKVSGEATPIKSPAWMPEIRIETKETTTKPVDKVAPTDNPDSKAIDVQTYTPSSTSDQKKQIIIYNQGSPVILELGHEHR
jgi:hypothetical protein